MRFRSTQSTRQLPLVTHGLADVCQPADVQYRGLEKFAKDLLRDPLYMRLETNPYLQFFYILGQVPVYFAMGFAISLLFGGDTLQRCSSVQAL